jgi:hypothetical protein
MTARTGVFTMLGLILGLFIGVKIGQGTGRNPMEAQINIPNLQAQLSACQSKFQRSTVLYDGVMFHSRRWVIPADVEPVLIGKQETASYSHYDPKTQVETVQLSPKIQQ